LAEVLITLGIIGVVAAMTMPTLIQKHQKVETVTRLKKSYSVISQAFAAAQAKHGDIADWAEWDDAEVILDKYIIPELRGTKKYGKASNDKRPLCYDSNIKQHNTGSNNSSQYVWLDGVYITSPFFANQTSSVKLVDGSCLGLNPTNIVSDYPSNYEYQRRIFIDVNGSQGPNIAGEDLFFFTIVNNTIRPYGYNWSEQELSNAGKQNACNRKATYGGLVCAARIIGDGWTIKY